MADPIPFDPDAFLEEAFDPDAFLADTAGDSTPDASARLQTAPSTAAAPSSFYAEPPPSYVEAPNLMEQRRAEAETLRQAMQSVQRIGGHDTAVAAERISKAVGVPRDVVARNMPAWQQVLDQASDNPEKWIRDNPRFWQQLRDRPEVAGLVLTAKERDPITKALNQLWTWGGKAADAVGLAAGPLVRYLDEWSLDASAMTPEQQEARRQEIFAEQRRHDEPDEREALAAKQTERRDMALEMGNAPKKVLERDDAKARVLRDDPSLGARLATLAVRAQETKAGLDLSRKQFWLMLERALGRDTAETEGEIARLKEASTPRAYGDDFGAAALFSDMTTGSVSTLESLAAGGAGAVAGAAVAGGAALAVTKDPAKAGAAAQVGARLAGGAAAALSSFQLETGSTYGELMELKTSDGNAIPHEVAMGGAIVAGTIKAGLEMLQLKAMAKTLGPVQELLGGGGVEAMKRLLQADPTFRSRLAGVARQWVASAAEEGAEEVAQTATDQVTKYLVASRVDQKFQPGPVLDGEDLAESWWKGFTGALPLGAAGSGVRLLATHQALESAELGEQRVKALGELAQAPAVQAAPQDFAAMVQEATAASGQPVESLYVDAKAVQRFFQEMPAQEAQAALEAALGPEGPAKVAEALATGSRIEVPLETVLSTWGASEVGKATQGDSAVSPVHLTPRELAERRGEVEAEAKAIAEKELAAAAEKQEASGVFDGVEQQIAEAGRTKKEAKTARAVMQRVFETLAANSGMTVAQLAQQFQIKIGRPGQEQQAVTATALQQEDARTVLRNRFEAQVGENAEQGVTDYWVDPTTGALNRRAFDALADTAKAEGKPLVAHLSVEGSKYRNDRHGHEAGNALFRAAAQALVKLAPEAAKVGGDFAIYVSNQQELDELLAKVNADPVLAGYTFTGAVGADLKSAAATHGKVKDLAESSKTRALRGERPLGARGEGDAEVFPVAPRIEGVGVRPALRERYTHLRTTSSQDAFDDVFIERSTGLLTKDGWDRIPRKKFIASIDLNGIKPFNRAIGEAQTDVIIERFGRLMTEAGGEAFDAAHVSGDEFLAQFDSKEELEKWLRAVYKEAGRVEVDIDPTADAKVALGFAPDSQLFVDGLIFGRGVGETIDSADTELNRDKTSLTTQGLRGDEATLRRIKARARDSRSTRGDGQDGPGEGASDADRRGGVRSDEAGGAVDAGAVSDDARALRGDDEGSRSGDGSGEGSADSGAGGQAGRVEDSDSFIDESSAELDDSFDFAAPEYTPEQIEEARASVARMKKPLRKAWATGFLDFVEGKGPRPAPLSDSEGTKESPSALMARLERNFAEAGIVDPERGFRFGEDGRSIEKGSTKAKKKKGKGTLSEGQIQALARGRAKGNDVLENIYADAMRNKGKGRLYQEDEEKTLLVQHNISADGLRHALEMGGLPMPSIAVSGKTSPMTNFGEITLLGGPELVDPKRGVPAFDTDIYSPRYPNITEVPMVDEKGMAHAVERLRPAAEMLGIERIEEEVQAVIEEPTYIPDVFKLAYARVKGLVGIVSKAKETGTVTLTDFSADHRVALRDWVDYVAKGAATNETREVLEIVDPKTGKTERLPHTIENVLRVMMMQPLRGVVGGSLGDTRALGAHRFTSIADMQAARGRIASKREMSEQIEQMRDRFDALRSEANRLHGESGEEQWKQFLDLRVLDRYFDGESMQKALDDDFGHPVDPEFVAKVESFANDLRTMRTEYFEAKPQRIVQLSEFKAAVVQEDVSEELVESLKESGLEVVVAGYDESRSPNDMRREAIRETAGNLGLLFQDDDDKKSKAKGWMEIEAKATERVYDIVLNTKADISTVFHEMGHAFLDMLQQLAERPSASAKTQEQWRVAREWLGVAEGDAPTRAHHEKFARTFEAYLFEGKAPTKELAGLFTRMKLWLTRIYRTLAGIPGAELNEQARAVFDRLLATEAELQAHLKARGPALDMKALGVATADAVAQLDQDAESLEMGSRRAELAVLKERLRETESWWKEELEAEEELAAAAYEKIPARRAQRILLGEVEEEVLAGLLLGEDGKAPGPIVLDRLHVNAVLGKTRAAGIKTADDGVSPDEVAELSGFATGADMLRAVVALPSKESWVARQAAAEMERKHPSVLNDKQRLQRLVADDLHGAVERRILREWHALTQRIGGRQPAVESLKRAAQLIAEKRTLRELRPGRALQAERAAAAEKARAALKGEWAQAADAAKRELLNAYLYRELLNAQEEVEKLEDVAKAMRKPSRRATMGKASPAYRDASDFLLSAFGLSDDETAYELGTATLDAVGEQMANDGLTVGDWAEVLQPALDEGRGYRDLTVVEARALAEALQQIRAGVTQRTTVLVEGKRVEKEALIKTIVAEASAVLPARKPPGTAASDSTREWFAKRWGAISGRLANPIDFIRDLTGDDPESVLWKSIVQPIRDAKYREQEILRTVLAPLVKTMKDMPKEVRARLYEAVDGEKFFPRHTDKFMPPRRRFELLLLALNAGNASNLQRLTDGRNISEGEVYAAMATLTPAELDWVQKVWDQAETLRAPSFELEERDSGLKPKAIEAQPVVLPNGVALRGGYFPAIYEASASATGERQQANLLAGVLDGSFHRPGTPHSHTKARADQVAKVISFDPSNVYRHFSQVAHDIAYRETLKSVVGLVMHDDVQDALKLRLGAERTKEFRRWLQDIGQAQAAEATGADWAMKLARRLMGKAILGWRTPTALGDVANLPTAIASTPLTQLHLAKAMNEYARAPLRTRELALSKSAELREMADAAGGQFQKEMKKFATGHWLPRLMEWGPFGFLDDHAFIFMETVNVATSTPVWLGAYDQALTEGKNEKEAVRFADDILTRVFPSRNVVEMSGILRDKGWWGMTTIFYGYLSTAWRAHRLILGPLFTQEFRDAGAAGKAFTLGRVTGRAMGFYFAYQVLGELWMGRGPEDDEDTLEWLLRTMALAPLNLFPGDAAAAANAYWKGKPVNPRLNPLAAMVGQVLSGAATAADTQKDAEQRVLGGVRAAGVFIPGSSLITVQGKYIYEAAQGERSTTPLGIVSGLLYGEKDSKPLNPVTAIEEAAEAVSGQ